MTVLRTFNGGQTWNLMSTGSPSADWLAEGTFTDFNHGWAVGGDLYMSYGTIYKSIDGGQNWDTVLTTSGYLQSISFPCADTGYVCGSDGVFLKTTDAGQTWNDVLTGLTNSYRHVSFNNSMNGYAVCTQMQNNVIHTVDGGMTWIPLSVGPAFCSLQKILNIDDAIAYLNGYNRLMMKTNDGGLSWTELCMGSHATFYDIFFQDQLNGWAAGFGYPSSVAHTTNGGVSWEEFTNPLYVVGPIRSIYFGDMNNGLMVGDFGPFLKTTNGGLNWESYPVIEGGTLLGIHFFDPLNGSGFNHSYRYFTTDGGQTWDNETIPYNRWINAVCYKDQHSAWLAGQGGTVLLWSDTVNVSLPNPPVPDGKLSAYPNPASKFISISCGRLGEENFPASLKLIDLLGNTVLNINLVSKQQCNHIKLPQTSEGLYIGMLETQDHQKYFVKIYIKNKGSSY